MSEKSISPLEKGAGGIEFQSDMLWLKNKTYLYIKKMNKSHYNKNLNHLARELRNESTIGEIILWKKVLRARKMHGYQFLRQYPILNYIVDFICRKLRIIIEIDGYSHNFKYIEDKIRDAKLQELGYKILRFTESQVRKDLDNVVTIIENSVLDAKENEEIS